MAKKEGSTAVDSVFKVIKDNGVKMVDLKFVDFPGQWQHFTVPVTELSEDVFESRIGI
jgi:glutamine synthetase